MEGRLIKMIKEIPEEKWIITPYGNRGDIVEEYSYAVPGSGIRIHETIYSEESKISSLLKQKKIYSMEHMGHSRPIHFIPVPSRGELQDLHHFLEKWCERVRSLRYKSIEAASR